jgi:hypothetical protein
VIERVLDVYDVYDDSDVIGDCDVNDVLHLSSTIKFPL